MIYLKPQNLKTIWYIIHIFSLRTQNLKEILTSLKFRMLVYYREHRSEVKETEEKMGWPRKVK